MILASPWQPGYKILFGKDHHPAELGQRLGGGGEGEVFELAVPARSTFAGSEPLAVKLYYQPPGTDELRDIVRHGRTALRSPFLQAETGNPKSRYPLIAAPRALIYGCWVAAPIGIAVLKVPASFSRSIDTLLRSTKDGDLRFSLRVAQECSRAVAVLHAANYSLGDMSPNNFRVDVLGNTVVIDVDSFGFRMREGRVRSATHGTENYEAPERAQTGATRSTDDFALAMIVLHLLLRVHPFGGVHKQGSGSSVQKNIDRGASWLLKPEEITLPAKQRGHTGLGCLPTEIRQLAQKALTTSALKRPTASQWEKNLRAAASKICQCSCGEIRFRGSDCRLRAKHMVSVKRMADDVIRPPAAMSRKESVQEIKQATRQDVPSKNKFIPPRRETFGAANEPPTAPVTSPVKSAPSCSKRKVPAWGTASAGATAVCLVIVSALVVVGSSSAAILVTSMAGLIFFGIAVVARLVFDRGTP